MFAADKLINCTRLISFFSYKNKNEKYILNIKSENVATTVL